jgi:glycosyltransferase involved in cell wall biosynthesis
VVASAIAGLKERITPGGNGFTFPARDSRALADLMASLVGNEPQWLKVNRGIEQPMTDVEMLETHESVWQDIAARRSSLKTVSLILDPPAQDNASRARSRRKLPALALDI